MTLGTLLLAGGCEIGTVPDVENEPNGGPLAELREVFLELTAKIEAKETGLDDALLELRKHEAVDAAGHTWRIDPMTEAFIRRAPEPGAIWRPADPADFAEEAPAHRVSKQRTRPDVPMARQPVPPTQYMVPVAGPATGSPGSTPPGSTPPGSTPPAPPQEPPRESPAPPPSPTAEGPADRDRRPRLSFAVAGAVAVILIVTLVVSLFTGGEPEPAAQTPAAAPSNSSNSSKPERPGTQPGTQPAANAPVPSDSRCESVINEVTSGDVDRISAVIVKSQFGPNGRRMYAATYAGWVNAGLTIEQRPAAADGSGGGAAQRWELRRGSRVIATADVAWQRDDRGWRPARWPEFRPVD